MRVINYILAPFKVFLDKSSHYIKSSFGTEIETKNEEIIDDKLEDYIDVTSYQDEEIHNRLYNHLFGFETLYTLFASPTHIVDNIYLGSAINAASYYMLRNLGIKIIINVTNEISDYYPDEFTYVRIPVYDDNKQSIKDYLDNTVETLNKYSRPLSNDNNILVHCFMGASRSVSIVLYYLIKRCQMDDLERKLEIQSEAGINLETVIQEKKVDESLHDSGEIVNYVSEPEEDNIHSFQEALEFIRKKRPIINPTFRFAKDITKSIILG